MATLDRWTERSAPTEAVAVPPLEPREAYEGPDVDLPRTRRAELDGNGALSRMPPGALVRVERVLFDIPRAKCEALGIRAGTTLRCMAWLPDAVLVKLAGGDTVSVDTEIADFVSVCPEGSAADGDGCGCDT